MSTLVLADACRWIDDEKVDPSYLTKLFGNYLYVKITKLEILCGLDNLIPMNMSSDIIRIIANYKILIS